MPEERALQAVESYKKAVMDLDTAETTTVLAVVLIILLISIILLVIAISGKRIKEKIRYRLFSKYAKEKELEQKQIDILWKYSKFLNRDPFLTLEFKAPFEKVINEYINHEPEFDEALVKDMRQKLGFDVIPELMPLVVTKDIELFQNGKLITPEVVSYDIVLFDKNERFMYWMVMCDERKPSVSKGTIVKIVFTRKNDAVYNINVPVLDVIEEEDKIILKFPHTFDLVRVQRREYPRINVDIDALIRRIDYEEEILKGRPVKWNYVRIHDISAGGIKICIPSEKRADLNLYINHKVQLKFELKGRNINAEGVVVNINEKKKTVCYGIKFTNIPKDIVEFIASYVQKERQRILKNIKGRKW